MTSTDTTATNADAAAAVMAREALAREAQHQKGKQQHEPPSPTLTYIGTEPYHLPKAPLYCNRTNQSSNKWKHANIWQRS